MQEISLNPQKLAGQCSKLKCCLMYEYDVYADARRSIPRVKEPLQTIDGEYFLVKIDPLAHTMTFSTSKTTMANLTTLSTSRVREIIALNRAGQRVDKLLSDDAIAVSEEPTYRHEEDSITRFDKQGKRNKRNKRRNNNAEGKQSEGREERQNEHREGKQSAEERQNERREERRDNRSERREGRDMSKEGNDPVSNTRNTPRDNTQRQGRNNRNRNRNFRDRRYSGEGGANGNGGNGNNGDKE